MKAVYINEGGGPEVMVYGDRPDPEPGELLVRVRSSAINFADLGVRSRYSDSILDCHSERVIGTFLQGGSRRARKPGMS